ncbi:MAG: ATP-binding protein, partial [Desulfobacterales bacterium]|nr:ATP-binding protein [Desulfobacterales bacterium]
IFFGREEQVEGMLNRLREKRFLAVVGPSGCGKSSLVNAGLLPALEQGFLIEAGDNWRMALFRPGDRPIWNMAEALYRALAEKPDELPETLDPTEIAFAGAGLRRGPLGIARAFHEARLPGKTNLLILADQFEEIFRFREQQDPNEAIAFVNLLLSSAGPENTRIYTAITMRADYLGDCALFLGLPEALNDSRFLTPRLTRDQLRAAITGPAARFGKDIDPVLVNRLLNDMGTDPDQLPLMQHALMRMWSTGKPLDVGLYKSIGGLENALSNHADRIYDGLRPGRRRIAEILFRSLSERAAGKSDTRRPVKLSEPAEIAGVDVSELAETVEPFLAKGRHFLTPPPGKPLAADTVIDI